MYEIEPAASDERRQIQLIEFKESAPEAAVLFSLGPTVINGLSFTVLAVKRRMMHGK